MVFRCNGCGAEPTRHSSFIQHLERATDPRCIRVREELENTLRRPFRHDRPAPLRRRLSHNNPGDSSGAGAPEDNPDIESTPAPQPENPPAEFEGDFSGRREEYTEDDFPSLEGQQDAPHARVPSDFATTVTESDDDEDDPEDEAVGQDALDGTPDQEQGPTITTSSPRRSPSASPACSRRSQTPMDIDAGADKEDLQQSAQNGDDNLRSGPGGVQPEAHEQLHQAPVKVRAYGRQAGAIINEFDIRVSAYREYQLKVNGSTDNPYAPFACELDWDLARWAKLRNISASALNELLSIKGIVEKLGLSYKNSGELNRVIDEQLPLRRPAFVHHEATVMGEKFDMYARDIMQCILALYGDAEHARYLCIMPERHYADADETIRLYHDLHTGRWWWDTQVCTTDSLHWSSSY
ncbi:hypothetical protein C8T65DRAFT_577371 [Cerioporus squamosus]|nr:hypothetical protein C8T65DRAFT_577371 [Cerioporus squamosus]